MSGYRDLKVWELGVELSLKVYRLTSCFPKSEQYGLSSQMQRAAVSIPSNIAEGHARRSQGDFLRFLRIAKGSLAELETQLIISQRLGLAEKDRHTEILNMTEEESQMLSGLIRSVQDTK
ncbi:four helix bundle protein [Bythopirellula polymerisocia]|uniref:Four helix bundle protein n=1 Tax=Bythopirellula polymerisocia TaxID=2528003 RepID=A0A5C6C6X5_9BACT|nr:four helix bundle protein [Bythopirellula polymerisocia]TWU20383.1 hypothetical protein Pla144_49580 [Bythopirellula polymerisocia]